jgi:hypothetical protein
MANEIHIPERPMSEERRLMAETIQETAEALELLYKNSHILAPGETAGNFRVAWEYQGGPKDSLVGIVDDLLEPLKTDPRFPSKTTDQHLRDEGLIGSSGKFKRHLLGTLRDEALRKLRPDSNRNIDVKLVTNKELKAGGEALGEYFEACATFVKSMCPYATQAVEFLSYAKQVCKLGGETYTHLRGNTSQSVLEALSTFVPASSVTFSTWAATFQATACRSYSLTIAAAFAEAERDRIREWIGLAWLRPRCETAAGVSLSGERSNRPAG